MLRRICEEYGSPLPEGQYAFPTAESLADDVVEERLRELGFGCACRLLSLLVEHAEHPRTDRAAYVAHTAEILLESAAENKSSPHATLSSIASLPTSLEQREALQLFSGVGPKVADCVRLFGLGQKAVVPVDVHVARIAARDYNVKCPTASMTKDGYVVVQKALEERWGMFAGWAQQILFAAELAPTTFAATTMTTPVKVKKEAVAYPTPATTPVKRAVELAVELVEAIETKPDVELEACMSLAERTKLRRKRRKV